MKIGPGLTPSMMRNPKITRKATLRESINPWGTLHLLHLMQRKEMTIPFHPPAWPGSRKNWRMRSAS